MIGTPELRLVRLLLRVCLKLTRLDKLRFMICAMLIEIML